jgi:hypothetical protein
VATRFKWGFVFTSELLWLAGVITWLLQPLTQVFEALKLSLALAIQHGLLTVLIFCGLTILATLLFKDRPLANQFEEKPNETNLPK